MNPGQVYIEHLGCAKNQVDAEIMISRLEDAGWWWTDDPATASLILVNTCAFIEPAQQESIDATLSLAGDYPDTPIALTGCMAQRFPEELAQGIPELAGIFGNRDPGRIGEFVARLRAGVGAADAGRGVTDADGGATGQGAAPVVWLPDADATLPGESRRRLFSHPGSAYVKVAEGCDHSCSFCAIPSIRGTLRVRTAESLLEEIEELAATGVREFNLVAQDLAAWSGPGGIVALIRRLLERPGEYWIRPLYLYPDSFPLELVRIAREDPRLLPYFDLSFQHASPRILRAMGRPGSPEEYLRLIDEIRGIHPDVVLRSSFIVGFPGETDQDQRMLLDFLQRAEVDWVGVFEFSPQTGTPAARLAERESGPDPEAVAARRAETEELQESIMIRRLARWEGRTLQLLVEEPMEGAGLSIARSRLNAPDVDGLVVLHHGENDAPRPGEFVEARITGLRGIDLQAELIDHERGR